MKLILKIAIGILVALFIVVMLLMCVGACDAILEEVVDTEQIDDEGNVSPIDDDEDDDDFFDELFDDDEEEEDECDECGDDGYDDDCESGTCPTTTTTRNDSRPSVSSSNSDESNVEASTTSVPISKCKMWAILLADTEDETIGKEDLHDNKTLNNELKGIAKALDLELAVTNITGSKTRSKANLRNAINAIKPSADDIVFFCFNGHGFRWDNQKDKYPNICLDAEVDEVDGYYVSTTDIYNAIVAKGARLSIVFTDCCNSKFGEKMPPHQNNTLYSRDFNSASKERMKDLFLGSKGTILATAARPGEMAWSFEGGGSAFTQSFIKQLHQEVSKKRTDEVSWQRIVDGAIKSARVMTEDCSNAQNGIRYMNVSKK